MTFTCIICKRNQPAELGRALPSGSWVCKDTDDCVEHIEEHPPHMQSRPRDCPICVKLLKDRPRDY